MTSRDDRAAVISSTAGVNPRGQAKSPPSWLIRGFALVPAILRRFVRSREVGLVLLASLVGALAATLRSVDGSGRGGDAPDPLSFA